MPEPSAEPEPVPSEPEPADQEVLQELLVWFLRAAATGYLVGMFARMWSDDELRLHLLHAILQVLHVTTRSLGEWALYVETQYNKHVDSLH